MLYVRDDAGEIRYDKIGDAIMADDWGYNIHFTKNSNTAGCIGIKSKFEAIYLMWIYKFNEKYDPNSSKIIVKGVEA